MIRQLAEIQPPRAVLYFGLSKEKLSLARVLKEMDVPTMFNTKVSTDTEDFEYSGDTRIDWN